MKDKMFYCLFGFVVCLAVMLSFNRLDHGNPAHAQAHGTSAGSATVVLGEAVRGVFPLILVDTDDDSLMIYELDASRTRWRLTLQSARTYRYDKQLREYNIEDPSVRDVRRRLEQEAQSR